MNDFAISVDIAQRIGILCRGQQLKLTVAESCSGGGLAYAITSVPGSSEWFERGFITYSNESKHDLLGVSEATVNKYGAVSRETAGEMVAGAITHSQAQAGIAITGIAGPDGGSEDKPVGTVFIAWQVKRNDPIIFEQHYTGDRLAIREQAIRTSLQNMLDLLSE